MLFTDVKSILAITLRPFTKMSRLAVNIAKLPELLRKLDAGAIFMPLRLPPIRVIGVRPANWDQTPRRGLSDFSPCRAFTIRVLP